MNATRLAATLLAAMALGQLAVAQSPDLAFEVAAIRRNTSESTGGGGGPRPGGRYRLTNMPVRSLVAVAWNLPGHRVLDGPDWIGVERYDLEATTKESPTREELQGMLRALLRDRFKAVVRVEQRELPVYHLVPARADGTLGPELERTPFNCDDPEARKQAAATIPSRPGRMLCGFASNEGSLDGGGVTMDTLALILASPAGRPVLNRTGLAGGYNLTLKWTPSLGTDAPPGDAVSIFTAVQEQLGLRLQSGTAPLDVAVIERIERPTEN